MSNGLVMPDISVVLPCYRGARLAIASVAELETELARHPYSWEIIVVDDGGGDFPADIWAAEDRSREFSVRLLRLPVNQGKGAAVRAGMLAARGVARVFTDVDLPYEPALVVVAAHYLLSGNFHLVVGDRALPSSSYELNVDLRRQAASRLFSTVVGTLVTGGFFDTQCGFKAVRGDVAELLIPVARIDRFAFDVELLYLALRHKLDIKRIPVQLRRNETSSVRLVRDSVRALVDVGRIKYHQLRGWYDCPGLYGMVQKEFARVYENADEPPVAVGRR
jgi:dolichyl-phosphate beta-glucosyltransferase